MTHLYDTPTKIVPEVCAILTMVLLMLGATPMAQASALIARDDDVWFEPGADYVDITHVFLRGNDEDTGASIHLVPDDSAPLHGTVTVLGDAFRYTPSTTSGLESLRTDAFTYALDNGFAVAYGTVRVILRTDDVELARVDFEAGDPAGYVAYDPPGTTVATLASAAAVGSQGLSVTVSDGTQEAFIEIPADQGPSETGRVVVVGCEFDPLQQRVMILAVGASRIAEGEEALRVVLQPDGAGGVEILLEVQSGATFSASPSLPVDADLHHMDLDWWPAVDGPAGLELGGAILRLDGEAVEVGFLDATSPELSTVQVGIMPLEPVSLGSIHMEFDHIRTYAQGLTAGEPLVFFDDFEAGDLDGAWDDAHGSGASVSGAGAFSGAFGLLADPAYSTSYHVAADPLAETRLNARFRLDVARLVMAEGDLLRLFDFGSDTNPLFGLPDVNIRLTRLDGKLQITAVGTEPTGLASTPWQPVSGTHTVELQWQGSLGSNPSGYFRLWLDGQPIAVLRHLDSLSEPIEWLRLGILGVDPGTQGSLMLDDLLVWR
ncbi:MAG: hypothetical protein AAF657_13745 [Acidobacteriota bacterium]